MCIHRLAVPYRLDGGWGIIECRRSQILCRELLSRQMMTWSLSMQFISDDIELIRLVVDTIFLRILALM
jgi:hypothetical protein